MTARVIISGDKRAGFIWQLVDNGKVLKSGREMTEVKAVNSSQDALIEHKRKSRGWGKRWSAAAKSIPIDKLTS